MTDKIFDLPSADSTPAHAADPIMPLPSNLESLTQNTVAQLVTQRVHDQVTAIKTELRAEMTQREEAFAQELRQVKEKAEEDIAAMKQHFAQELENIKKQGEDTKSKVAVLRERGTAGRKVAGTYELLEKIILQLGPDRHAVLNLTQVNTAFDSVIKESSAIRAAMGLRTNTLHDMEDRELYAPEGYTSRLSNYYCARPKCIDSPIDLCAGSFNGIAFEYQQIAYNTRTIDVSITWPAGGALPDYEKWATNAYLSMCKTDKRIRVTIKKQYPGKKEFAFTCSVLSSAETIGEVFQVAEELVAGCPTVQFPDAPHWYRETLTWMPRSILDVPSAEPEAIDLMLDVPEYTVRRMNGKA